MKSLTNSQCIFMLFILCIVRLGCCAPQNNDGVSNTTNNPPVEQSKGIETYSAAEMCSKYSKLIYKYIKDPVMMDGDDDELIEVKDCHNHYPSRVLKRAAKFDDKRAAPREFSHMALLGYNNYPRNDSWGCSGSLISNRWILSAANCERQDNKTFVSWTRLRDLNYLSEADDARPMDYQIDQRIVHPDYQKPSLYYDIALFHLDQDVKFSSYDDPGGPLQIAHANYYSCTYTQVGITSAGKGQCATKNWPTIYTRVSKFLPWIERIIWLKSA